MSDASRVRTGLALALAAATWTLGACASTGTTPVPVAGGESAIARARAYGARVNLREGDLPGFSLVGAAGERVLEARPGAHPAAARGCYGRPVYGEIVALSSPTFARRRGAGGSASAHASLSVRSTVVILPSAAAALALLARASSSGLVACLAREATGAPAAARCLDLAEEVLRESCARGRVEVSPLAPGAVGVPLYALRLRACAGAGRACTRGSNAVEDYLALARGSALLTLRLSTRHSPPAPALERRLVLLLSERANSQAAARS